MTPRKMGRLPAKFKQLKSMAEMRRPKVPRPDHLPAVQGRREWRCPIPGCHFTAYTKANETDPDAPTDPVEFNRIRRNSRARLTQLKEKHLRSAHPEVDHRAYNMHRPWARPDDEAWICMGEGGKVKNYGTLTHRRFLQAKRKARKALEAKGAQVPSHLRRIGSGLLTETDTFAIAHGGVIPDPFTYNQNVRMPVIRSLYYRAKEEWHKGGTPPNTAWVCPIDGCNIWTPRGHLEAWSKVRHIYQQRLAEIRRHRPRYRSPPGVDKGPEFAVHCAKQGHKLIFHPELTQNEWQSAMHNNKRGGRPYQKPRKRNQCASDVVKHFNLANASDHKWETMQIPRAKYTTNKLANGTMVPVYIRWNTAWVCSRCSRWITGDYTMLKHHKTPRTGGQPGQGAHIKEAFNTPCPSKPAHPDIRKPLNENTRRLGEYIAQGHTIQGHTPEELRQAWMKFQKLINRHGLGHLTTEGLPQNTEGTALMQFRLDATQAHPDGHQTIQAIHQTGRQAPSQPTGRTPRSQSNTNAGGGGVESDVRREKSRKGVAPQATAPSQQSSHDPNKARRIGEASHPAPWSTKQHTLPPKRVQPQPATSFRQAGKPCCVRCPYGPDHAAKPEDA